MSFRKRLMALQRHPNSVILSFIFVHSVMNKIGTKVPSIVCVFKGDEVRETHFYFLKHEILRFHICKLESYKSIERKGQLFDYLWTTEISSIFKLSVYIDIVLLNFSKYFQNNLNYFFYSNYS